MCQDSRSIDQKSYNYLLSLHSRDYRNNLQSSENLGTTTIEWNVLYVPVRLMEQEALVWPLKKEWQIKTIISTEGFKLIL